MRSRLPRACRKPTLVTGAGISPITADSLSKTRVGPHRAWHLFTATCVLEQRLCTRPWPSRYHLRTIPINCYAYLFQTPLKSHGGFGQVSSKRMQRDQVYKLHRLPIHLLLLLFIFCVPTSYSSPAQRSSVGYSAQLYTLHSDHSSTLLLLPASITQLNHEAPSRRFSHLVYRPPHHVSSPLPLLPKLTWSDKHPARVQF